MKRYIEVEAEGGNCLYPHTQDSGSKAAMTRAGCRPERISTPAMLSLLRNFI